jgi:hypothetical protein
VVEHELGLVEKQFKKLTKEREYTVNKRLDMQKNKRENEITQDELKLHNDERQSEY